MKKLKTMKKSEVETLRKRIASLELETCIAVYLVDKLSDKKDKIKLNCRVESNVFLMKALRRHFPVIVEP